MNKFREKNALLIAPFFNGYENEIKKALMSNGFDVTCYFFSGFNKRVFSFLRNEEQYWHKNKNEIKKLTYNKVFDYLLVINNSLIDLDLMQILRKKNDRLKTVIYLWDPVENLHWADFETYICRFDYRYSFDIHDCRKYSGLNLKHRPNFYHPIIDTLDFISKPKYDIATVMSAQPERVRIINELSVKYPELSMAFHIHLLRIKSIPAYLFNHGVVIKPKYIKLNKLDIKQSMELLNNSKSVLDILFHNQHGFPFRSIDAIGLQKKLITNKKDILGYDFYHPDNILIIQSGKIDEVKNFLSVPYRPIEESIRIKYSLDFWIKAIMSNENINYLKIS